MGRKTNLWYFPLEPVASRYTEQLCDEQDGWMTKTFDECKSLESTWLDGNHDGQAKDIKTGAVLDTHTRVRWCFKQCEQFLDSLRKGEVKNGDIIYLQDLSTPGFEGVLYALDMAGIETRNFAMVHANTYDPFDFMSTVLGSWACRWDDMMMESMEAVFVASTVHKEQILSQSPHKKIHVVGLPFDSSAVPIIKAKKKQQVVYSSRIDREKNPDFMLKVARDFLEAEPKATWVCTTSAKEFRSYNNAGIVGLMRKLAAENPRFILKEGLTKEEYYTILAESMVQFNCADQDYVSWTAIEAAHQGCSLVYPYNGSFLECLKDGHLYTHNDPDDAVGMLQTALYGTQGSDYRRLVKACDHGRQMIPKLILKENANPYNLWNGYTTQKGIKWKPR
jgi:glycosyltransferase involved in cell wall biosynthesis